MSTHAKLPLGIKPKHISQNERLQDLRLAIDRYIQAGESVDPDWLMEYYEIVEYLFAWEESRSKAAESSFRKAFPIGKAMTDGPVKPGESEEPADILSGDRP